ncbi:No apical meristem-associated, C-terminal domain [Sesbania bispinosa]|nr:No apical meristem-associated, C-terminal domain [Sesbania bispinosa]
MQKFVGCYVQAVRRRKSGCSENDVMNDAFAIFNQDEGESFKFEYAWRLLKDNPKWNSECGGGSSKRTKIYASGAYTSSSPSETPTNFDPDSSSPSPLQRPMGTKMAKRKVKDEIERNVFQH